MRTLTNQPQKLPVVIGVRLPTDITEAYLRAAKAECMATGEPVTITALVRKVAIANAPKA